MSLDLYMSIVLLFECSACMYTVIDTNCNVFGQCSVCQRSCLWSDVDDVAECVDALFVSGNRCFLICQ